MHQASRRYGGSTVGGSRGTVSLDLPREQADMLEAYGVDDPTPYSTTSLTVVPEAPPRGALEHVKSMRARRTAISLELARGGAVGDSGGSGAGGAGSGASSMHRPPMTSFPGVGSGSSGGGGGGSSEPSITDAMLRFDDSPKASGNGGRSSPMPPLQPQQTGPLIRLTGGMSLSSFDQVG